MSQCINCKSVFIKGPKGFNRLKVLTVTSPSTSKAVFPETTTPTQDRFICQPCYRDLTKQEQSRKTKKGVQFSLSKGNKRCSSELTPGKSPNPKRRIEVRPARPHGPTCVHAPTPRRATGPLAKAKEQLRKYRYESALRWFLRSSVKHHLIAALSKAIQGEVS